MIEKLKATWRAQPDAYELGLARGFTIAGALELATYYTEARPWLALAWLVSAALGYFVIRKERRVAFDDGETFEGPDSPPGQVTGRVGVSKTWGVDRGGR